MKDVKVDKFVKLLAQGNQLSKRPKKRILIIIRLMKY